MAGDPNLDFRFFLSGGVSNNDAQLSLGGTESNAGIESRRPTITAVGAAGDRRVFLSAVSASSGAAVMTIRDGASGGFVSRVTDYDIGGGWVEFLDPLPSTVAIGDALLEYRSSDIATPWGSVSALECAQGFTQYFGGYFFSQGVGSYTGVGLHIEETNPGTVIHEIAVANNPLPNLLNTISDRTEAPDLSGMMISGGAGSWSQPLAKVDRVPRVAVAGFNGFGFWIKRILPPNSVRQTDQITSLVITDDASLEARLVIHWNTIGFTPTLTFSHAPSLYVRGGAQYKANVISLETGLPVPGVGVGMRQTAGLGTFYPPADEAVTDERGEILGRYTSPVDVAEVGNTVTVEAEV